MITSSRIGRYGNLCNSMFQFAAVVGMAKKTGLEYCIPHNKTYFEPNYGCNNTSIWDGFDLNVQELDLGILKFKEVEFPFEYKDIRVEDFTDMKGFFQSEKFFENAEEEIKAQFQIKEEHKEVVDLKIEHFETYPDPRQCTSLHIRLGDYVHKRAYHPAQPGSYWQEAVASAALDHIVIFSDEIEQAKLMFKGDSRVVYADEKNPFSALYHMSLCRNHIVCNSTFGWWGAKLGEWNNPVDKLVVAPKIWFGPAHNLSSEDIIPDRWIKL